MHFMEKLIMVSNLRSQKDSMWVLECMSTKIFSTYILLNDFTKKKKKPKQINKTKKKTKTKNVILTIM